MIIHETIGRVSPGRRYLAILSRYLLEDRRDGPSGPAILVKYRTISRAARDTWNFLGCIGQGHVCTNETPAFFTNTNLLHRCVSDGSARKTGNNWRLFWLGCGMLVASLFISARKTEEAYRIYMVAVVLVRVWGSGPKRLDREIVACRGCKCIRKSNQKDKGITALYPEVIGKMSLSEPKE